MSSLALGPAATPVKRSCLGRLPARMVAAQLTAIEQSQPRYRATG